MRVLIADDDAAFIQLNGDLLRMKGYEVITADSGEQALFKARESRPDVLVMDYMMPPGIDGVETTRRLKADPDLKTIAVVICSSTCLEKADVEKAKAAGACDYISKPFTVVDFLNRIEAAARGSQR